MKKIYKLAIATSIILFTIHCGKLRNRQKDLNEGCNASRCHLATDMKAYYPVNNGYHLQHVEKQQFSCDTCHQNYDNNALHKNAVINDYRDNSRIVYLDGKNPNGTWTVPTTTCANLACHGSANWYGNVGDNCSFCHAAGNKFSDNKKAPDPLITYIAVTNGGTGYTSTPSVTITGGGGSGATATPVIVGGVVTGIIVTSIGTAYTTPPTITITGGGGSGATATGYGFNNSHNTHLAKSLMCTDCHNGYKQTATHANGTLNGSISTGTNVVSFNPGHDPGANYNTGNQSCNNTYCHGNFPGGNGVNSNPTWGSIVNCSNKVCHGTSPIGNPASSTANPDTKHATHVNNLMKISNPASSSNANYTEAETCAVCHNGMGYGTVTHINDAVNIAFNDPAANPAAPSPGKTGGVYSGGQFNATSGAFNNVTCQNTYCHGNFAGGNASNTVSYTDTAGAAMCGTCHSNTAPPSVKHTKHLAQYPGKCDYCHKGYTTTSTTSDHVNFQKYVAFDYLHPANTTAGLPTFDSSTKTCNNVYCHGNFPQVTFNSVVTNTGNNQNPTWQNASTATCGSCHGTVTDNYSSPTHGKHTATTSPYYNNPAKIEGCDACHFNATHANFSIAATGVNSDVLFKADNAVGSLAARLGAAGLTGIRVPGQKTTWNSGTTSCSNSWCHGNWDDTAGTGLIGLNATPNWLVSSTGACGTCHATSAPVTGAHTKHTSPPYSYSCSKCHSSFPNHVNGIVGTGGASSNDIAFDSTNPNGSYVGGTQTCNNLYCHGNIGSGSSLDWGAYASGASAKGNNNPTWNAGAQACGSCHDATKVTLSTGSHTKHINNNGTTTYNFNCNECHNNTVQADNTTLTSGHADGALTIAINGTNNPSGTFNSVVKSCSSFYCHGTFTGGHGANIATWGNTGAGSGGACGECHDNAPLNSNYGNHDKHTNTTATGGYNLDCATCHNGEASGKEGATITLNAITKHVNFLRDVTFNAATADFGTGTVASYNTTTHTCSGTYCHGDFAAGNTVNVATWDTGNGGACGACHANAPANTSFGKHDKHTDAISPSYNLDCADCHNGEASGTESGVPALPALVSKTKHVNYQVDVTFSARADQGGSTVASYNSTNRNCSSTYCHGDFAGGSTSNVPNWFSGVGAACGNCHTTNPTTVKHTQHLAKYSNQCGYCHSGYTNVSTPAKHVDWTKFVSFGYAHPANTVGSPTYTPASKTCNNVYCHGNFPQVTYNGTANTNTGNNSNPIWQDASTATCGTCHGSPANNYSSPTHGKHTATTSSYFNNANTVESCDACHAYGTETNLAFTSTSDQGSHSTANHANFSIAASGVNADVNFKADNTAGSLAARLGGAGYVAPLVANQKTTWNGATTSCSNAWCHGNFKDTLTVFTDGLNATPNWLDKTTAACGTCHNANAPTTGAHPKHTSPPYNYSCTKCHNTAFTGHINGTVGSGAGQANIAFDATNPNGTYDGVTTTCSNLYCHGNSDTIGAGADWTAYNDPATALNNNPKWTVAAGGGPGSVPCGTCHKATSGTLTSGAHDKHIGNFGVTKYNFQCARCHNDSIQLNGTTMKPGHADGALEVIADGNNPSGVYTKATKSCANFYCHGNFTGGTPTNISKWNQTGAGSGGNCGECHDLAPTNANYGSHDIHTNTIATGYNFPCSDCHKGEVTNGNAEGGAITFASIALHVNFARDVNFDSARSDSPGIAAAGITTTVASYNTATNTCSNTYCHGDFPGGKQANVPNWATKTGGTCGNCHGLAPANADFGVHDLHTDAIKYNRNCELCHNGIATGNEASSPAIAYGASYKTYHVVNFTPDVRYSGLSIQGPGAVASYNNNTRDCSSTYCHGDFRSAGNAVWPEGNTTNVPNWNTGSSAACGTCHGTTTGTNANLGIPNTSNMWHTSESHVKHAGNYAGNSYLFPCGFCHLGVYDATISVGNGVGGAYETGLKVPSYALHANGVRNFAFYTAFTGGSSTRDSGTPPQEVTCSSMYCHSDGWNTGRTIPDPGGVVSPKWAGAKSTINCMSCHNGGDNNSGNAGSNKPAPDQGNGGGEGHYNPKNWTKHESSCAHCHDQTTNTTNHTSQFNDTIEHAKNRHVNRMKNIYLGLHAPASSSGLHKFTRVGGGRCYVYCHQTGQNGTAPKNHNPRSGWYLGIFSGSFIDETP